MNESYLYVLLLTLCLNRDVVMRTHGATSLVIKTSALSCRPNSAVACRSVNGRDGNRADLAIPIPVVYPGVLLFCSAK